VPARVLPTDRVRAKIDELFASDRELPEILEEVARLGAQLLTLIENDQCCSSKVTTLACSG